MVRSNFDLDTIKLYNNNLQYKRMVIIYKVEVTPILKNLKI